MSNQGGVQAAVRASTGTTLDYNGDWSALFDAQSIATGSWNGRMLAFINAQLSSSYTDLPGAMEAFAVNAGFANWPSMNTITVGGGGGPPATALYWSTDDLLLGAANNLTWG